jgi:hypothetical protein
VLLLELLDAPLLALGKIGSQFKSESRTLPDYLQVWEASQDFSEEALNLFASNHPNAFFPPQRMNIQKNVDEIWGWIDNVSYRLSTIQR